MPGSRRVVILDETWCWDIQNIGFIGRRIDLLMNHL